MRVRIGRFSGLCRKCWVSVCLSTASMPCAPKWQWLSLRSALKGSPTMIGWNPNCPPHVQWQNRRLSDQGFLPDQRHLQGDSDDAALFERAGAWRAVSGGGGMITRILANHYTSSFPRRRGSIPPIGLPRVLKSIAAGVRPPPSRGVTK